MQPRIILLNSTKTYFYAIEDKIEHDRIASDVHYAESYEDAMHLLPQHGPCVIVADSVINYLKKENHWDGTAAFAAWYADW